MLFSGILGVGDGNEKVTGKYLGISQAKQNSQTMP